MCDLLALAMVGWAVGCWIVVVCRSIVGWAVGCCIVVVWRSIVGPKAIARLLGRRAICWPWIACWCAGNPLLLDSVVAVLGHRLAVTLLLLLLLLAVYVVTLAYGL